MGPTMWINKSHHNTPMFQYINEIIKLQHNNVDVPEFTQEQLRNQMRLAKKKGLFGGGSVDEEDPHIFNKSTFQSTSSLKTDPYYNFIKASAKYAKSNPFLPRVYNITTQVDPHNKKKPSYKIESLIHFQQIPTDILANLLRAIDPELNKIVKQKWSNYEKGIYDEDPVEDEFIDFKTAVCQDTSNYLLSLIKGTKTTPNKQLQQAIDIIARVQKMNPNFYIDIHEYNFMFRRTPTGAQLVLTDPLASRG